MLTDTLSCKDHWLNHVGLLHFWENFYISLIRSTWSLVQVMNALIELLFVCHLFLSTFSKTKKTSYESHKIFKKKNEKKSSFYLIFFVKTQKDSFRHNFVNVRKIYLHIYKLDSLYLILHFCCLGVSRSITLFSRINFNVPSPLCVLLTCDII